MAEFYLRRLDVINRGFGGEPQWCLVGQADDQATTLNGKTTLELSADSRAIPVFETIFPKKEQRDKGCAQKVPLMTIWFGTFAQSTLADGRRKRLGPTWSPAACPP